jgi:rhamnosyltransferase
MDASVAVAIPVKNGYPEIRDCIYGLLKQTVRPARIYVMDSGSTDGTLDFLRTIPEVVIIPVAPADFNHGETRNLGWQNATEDFVYYTVQDARPLDDQLLERLLFPFSDPEVQAVCGQQVVPHETDKNPVEWFRPVSVPKTIRYQFANAVQFRELDPEEKKNLCAWDDVAAMYRRVALQKVPFRRVVFGEDMLWAKDALEAGFAIVYQQSARVYHYHLEDPEFSFRRALTTMYFRYRHFGFLPPAPAMTLRRRLGMLKTFAGTLGADPAGWLRWYRYNMQVFQAISKAQDVFTKSLAQGEQALDDAHERYCGKPHVLKKNHERSATIGERADDRV